MKNKNKIILFVIITIFVLILFLIFFIFKNINGTNQRNSQFSNLTINENTNNNLSNLVEIEFNKINTWNSNNKIFSQFNINLSNKSDQSLNNWKISISIPDDFEISQIWNATNSINKNTLIMTPVEYNNSISANSSIEIGFITSSISNFEVEKYSLYFSDVEYINSTLNSQSLQSSDTPKIEENLVTNTSTNISISDNTPVSTHGKITVSGTKIIDEHGNTFSLKGVSSHGLAWFPEYINEDSFKSLRDDFGINTIRLAMYSNPNDGYSKNIHEIVKNGVQYASDLGLYIIIDWHILNDNNPNIYKKEAKEFFIEMATLYKDYPNILYEICNEPNGNVTWDKDIKPYAEELITEIRKIDNDAIIIVGTPNWSQDVDIVAKDPLSNSNNIMYSLHFYAASHKQFLRDKMMNALNLGLPIFVSEFGICDASGNGIIDENEANIWIDTLNSNNISWICWNLSNKNESSSLISYTCNKTSNWIESDLSQSGKWLIPALKR